MLFKKQWLQDLVWDDVDDAEIIENEIVDTSRWSIHHTAVFKLDCNEKFYQTHYSTGATENQDESPYEYDPDEIECVEVAPVTKTITIYAPIK